MEREAALVILGDKAAASSRPVLSPESLGAILDQFRTVDADGRAPSDPDWTGAYDLNAAAAEAWRVKGGKVAGDFSFSADGASYQKADVLAHCLDMEAKYASLCHGTTATMEPESRRRLRPGWDGTQIP